MYIYVTWKYLSIICVVDELSEIHDQLKVTTYLMSKNLIQGSYVWSMNS